MENVEHTTNTSQTTAEENQATNLNSSKQLVQYENLEFPFTYVVQNGEQFLAIGNYKITRPDFSKEDYLNLIREKPWDLIFEVMSIALLIDKNMSLK